MRRAGLAGCHRRRLVRTTRRDPAAEPAPDLVQRAFSAPDPDQLWLADIPSVPTTEEGLLSLAVLLDVFSRRVVVWSMQAQLRAELVVAALEGEERWRSGSGGRAVGLVHHADHGGHYTSLLFGFGERCAAAGIRSSMGSVGDCDDNVMIMP